MKDRYKYRVWDKENKCLHYPTRYNNFTIVNGTVVKIESYPTANSAYLGKRIAWEFDDAVIMQCTGLKDKNGKLIYELDYVRYANNKYKVEIDKFLGISLTNILNGDTIVMDDIVLFNCEVIDNEFESNTKI